MKPPWELEVSATAICDQHPARGDVLGLFASTWAAPGGLLPAILKTSQGETCVPLHWSTARATGQLLPAPGLAAMETSSCLYKHFDN